MWRTTEGSLKQKFKNSASSQTDRADARRRHLGQNSVGGNGRLHYLALHKPTDVATLKTEDCAMSNRC